MNIKPMTVAEAIELSEETGCSVEDILEFDHEQWESMTHYEPSPEVQQALHKILGTSEVQC